MHRWIQDVVVLICVGVTQYCQLWEVSQDDCHCSANTAIHWSISLPILILKRPYNLFSYIRILFRSSRLIECGAFGSGSFWGDMFTRPYQSHVKDTFNLPHLHILWPGQQIRNKVQIIAVLQLFDFSYTKCCYRWQVRLLFWYTQCTFKVLFIPSTPPCIKAELMLFVSMPYIIIYNSGTSICPHLTPTPTCWWELYVASMMLTQKGFLLSCCSPTWDYWQKNVVQPHINQKTTCDVIPGDDYHRESGNEYKQCSQNNMSAMTGVFVNWGTPEVPVRLFWFAFIIQSKCKKKSQCFIVVIRGFDPLDNCLITLTSKLNYYSCLADPMGSSECKTPTNLMWLVLDTTKSHKTYLDLGVLDPTNGISPRTARLQGTKGRWWWGGGYSTAHEWIQLQIQGLGEPTDHKGSLRN